MFPNTHVVTYLLTAAAVLVVPLGGYFVGGGKVAQAALLPFAVSNAFNRSAK